MKYLLYILLACSLITIAKSQTSLEQSKYLYSPYSTITNHLRNLEPKNYNPELSSRSLFYSSEKQEKRNRLAIQLKQIFDGSGHYVDPSKLPRNRNHIDSVTNLHHYIVYDKFPEIYVEKVDNIWVYSEETIELIPSIHKKIYPWGTDKLLNISTKLRFNQTNTRYIGLFIWQHIGLLCVLITCIVIYKILSFLLNILLHRILKRILKKDILKELLDKLIMPLTTPLSLIPTLGILLVFLKILQLPFDFYRYLYYGNRIIVGILIIILVYHLVNVLSYYLKTIARRTETDLDDQLIPVVRSTLKVLVIILGSLVTLHNIGVNIASLLAGLSIGGIAFAFAAQDTLKNFFGSVMILIDGPFKIGDWVRIGDINGNIEEVGIRSTRIRTFSNSLVSIPNGNLATMTIDNFGARNYRRYKTAIAITYDTPPDVIEIFVEGIKTILESHDHVPEDSSYVYLNNFNDHSIDVLLYTFFMVDSWKEELQIRQEIMLQIIKLAKTLNVRFAFPTQTLFIEEFPEKKSFTPKYTRTKEEMKKLLQKHTR